MAAVWAYYNSGFFIGAYKEKMKGSPIIPALEEDFETMLQYYLVQKAITIFNAYLKTDPRRVVISQTILRKVLNPQAETVQPTATVPVVPATVAPV